MADWTRNRRRVLLISADGMRPDLFDKTLMPTCATLARDGVSLIDYHASYPTHSRVNITTISTGCLPGKHGFVANVFRVEGATEDGVIDTGDFEHVCQLDEFSGGMAIQVPTLPELLASQGRKSQIVATSSDAAGLIWNRRSPEQVFDLNLKVCRHGIEAIRRKLGPVPPESHPTRIPHILYTARAVSEHYLDDPELDFIGVWLSEPDHSLHHYGVGSPEVREALAAVDASVAEILDGLNRRGIRDDFDIFFISDHGHSTVTTHRSLGEYLDRALSDRFPHLPAMTTASDFVYPKPGWPTPSADDLGPLVTWIQDQPWCGGILGGSTEIAQLPGLLPLSAVWGGQIGDRTPLFAVTPSWSHAPNTFGLPGMIAGLTEQHALRATHGSASPYELHAFAVASGGSFRRGVRSSTPAGAQDLAPTICGLLGIEQPAWFDGRVLTETLSDTSQEQHRSGARVVVPAEARSAEYRPALIMREVGSSRYLHSAVNARSPLHGRNEILERFQENEDVKVGSR
jgi:arylsulfatase A-like enzyme